MTFGTIAAKEPILDMVSVLGPWGPTSVPDFASAPAGGTWEAVNRTVYYPIHVPVKCTLRRFWWVNGATVNAAATYAMAIYTNVDFKPAARITTQSAAQGTASQVQFVTPTAKVLTPDLYWLGLSGTSITTTTLFGHGFSALIIPLAKFHQATANCPNPAVPIQATNTTIWVCGFSTQTTP